jgi:RNA polymerase-binding transcription factor DksA
MVNEKAVLLRQELDQVQGQIATLEATLAEKPDYGLGRGAPAVTRWELDQALLQRLKERSVSLQRALSEMGKGTYGICERCGRSIHPDRLAVLPDTRMCAECARSGQKS